MCVDGEWADNIAIMATANHLKRDIWIVTSGPQTTAEDSLIIVESGVSGTLPILLAHTWEKHYDSAMQGELFWKLQLKECFIKPFIHKVIINV